MYGGYVPAISEWGMTLRVGTEPTHQQCRSARCGGATRNVSHHAHDFKESVRPLIFGGVISLSQ
jgi:hypothetical protein